jgi:hypothetical protein
MENNFYYIKALEYASKSIEIQQILNGGDA